MREMVSFVTTSTEGQPSRLTGQEDWEMGECVEVDVAFSVKLRLTEYFYRKLEKAREVYGFETLEAALKTALIEGMGKMLADAEKLEKKHGETRR